MAILIVYFSGILYYNIRFLKEYLGLSSDNFKEYITHQKRVYQCEFISEYHEICHRHTNHILILKQISVVDDFQMYLIIYFKVLIPISRG